ncbi:nitrilase-related carbon-nitrogen hydrolase [Curtobacterium sp. L1-20]|uniref:nitrilase-related carbon-nitrogen hydrolase n=1 Tax=Curtobacterium sp. L1-20 TaxID=3138181 RepID=UPI003B52CDF0
MSGVARVRCDQLAPALGDVAANVEGIVAAVGRALDDGVDVLVLPELATSGYVFRDRTEAAAAAITTEHALFRRVTERLHGTTTVVVLGFCERDGDVLRNSVAVVDASGVRSVYRKTHLWDREALVFEPGDDAPPVVTTAHGRIGVLVCYDMEFPEMPRMLALAGADLVAVPTNWPVGAHPERDRVAEVIAAQAAARGNGVFVACCDRAGTERGQDWNEASVIVDQFGWVVAEAPRGTGATTVTADVFPTLARDKSTSPHNDWLRDRRPTIYAREVPQA